MSEIVTIKSLGFKKLNNYEFNYFSERFLELINEATPEKLHVSSTLVSNYSDNVDKLRDICVQSRISNETAHISEIKKETQSLVVYFFNCLRSERQSPIASRKSAATSAFNALKPYMGLYNLPQRQQVQALRGLATDMRKPTISEYLTTLGLNDLIESIADVAERFAALLEQRSTNMAANNLGSAQPLREVMTGQYQYIATIAFAYSVSMPSEELSTFVDSVNRLIDDMKTRATSSPTLSSRMIPPSQKSHLVKRVMVARRRKSDRISSIRYGTGIRRPVALASCLFRFDFSV